MAYINGKQILAPIINITEVDGYDEGYDEGYDDGYTDAEEQMSEGLDAIIAVQNYLIEGGK